MVRVEKLSYGFPAKDLYHDISFSLEMGQHCALIGSNGTMEKSSKMIAAESAMQVSLV